MLVKWAPGGKAFYCLVNLGPECVLWQDLTLSGANASVNGSPKAKSSSITFAVSRKSPKSSLAGGGGGGGPPLLFWKHKHLIKKTKTKQVHTQTHIHKKTWCFGNIVHGSKNTGIYIPGIDSNEVWNDTYVLTCELEILITYSYGMC